ncbi:hypothetical protein GBAR_LOCUS16832 [Geodia barretti]|uniref:Uncharacterized protein n=1 Tax=Geodia barretti TaxID=519541 RepID=A0AA35SIB5_GEOBA|nr:hypothetical protein GBAR_LOCUS16832 [Geodia barretti]
MASIASAKKGGAVHVISGPLDGNSSALDHPPSPPVEGRVIGQRMNLSVGQSSRTSVHEGILLKRCRLSWRERIVEVIRDSAEFSGEITVRILWNECIFGE